MINNFLRFFVGTKHERELKRIRPMVTAINDYEAKIQGLSDAALQAKTAEFKEKLDRGAKLDDIRFEAFAVCREASKRSLGMRHYDVQLIGGMVLHEGKIAEMKTGEGKTLVATLACYLNALEGKGVHVVTVNDYLAKRDAEWMGKLYGFLGLSTGTVVNAQGEAEKKRAYRCDITYGQNNEFGFDYLRDNMKFSIYDYAQRELNFAIVDEVDSILVDEARTPLIISGPGETASEKYKRIAELIPKLRKDDHYAVDEKGHSVTLTEEGTEFVQKLFHEKGLTAVVNLYEPANHDVVHILQKSLVAHALYKRDQQYMVAPDGKVMIIDEHTGRVLPGRRWSDGLHQAVEAKENVPIQDENRTLATISFQNLFRLYNKLSGMTGTADTEASEFHKIYKLDVVVIPTNRGIQRKDQEDLVYINEKQKFRAVMQEIRTAHERGQPVLVGTTSVEKSDAIHRMLDKEGVVHNVLNAKQHEREAYVVAQAGRKGAITVATNMAGRGTDILLGGNPEMIARMDVLDRKKAYEAEVARALEAAEAAAAAGDTSEPVPPAPPFDFDAEIAKATEKYKAECEQQKEEVKALGGLYIVGTERHESRRIDNQLRGRAGRQGDPGLSRFYLSLEDDLMRIFGGERIQGLMQRMNAEEDVPIEHPWVTKSVENAQKKVEERNFDTRKNMLEYDDVMNQQRKSIYTLRRQILEGQFRSVPNEDEIKKGVKPAPLIKKVNEALAKRSEPIVLQMVKHHASPLPPNTATQEEMIAAREAAQKASVDDLTTLRVRFLEQDIYNFFGCRVDLKGYENKPKAALELLNKEVAMSLSEQRERLLELIDENIGILVETHCNEKKHFEDWDFEGLENAFREQFGLKAEGLRALGERQAIAHLLYDQAEKVFKEKEEAVTPERYLRQFRSWYLEDIDKQWIEHLSAMEHLRDGIGLRGYGQKDPKKEYKKEGFELFQTTMASIKSTVGGKMMRAQVVRDEDIQRVEEQRRRAIAAQQQRIRMNHADPSGQEGSPSLPPGAPGGPAGQPGQPGPQGQRIQLPAGTRFVAVPLNVQLPPGVLLVQPPPGMKLPPGTRLVAVPPHIQLGPPPGAPGGAPAQSAPAPAPAATRSSIPAPGGVGVVPPSMAVGGVPRVSAPDAVAGDDAGRSSATARTSRVKVGRNDPCWCGSGKKYKKCHMDADEGGTSAGR